MGQNFSVINEIWTAQKSESFSFCLKSVVNLSW